MTVISEVRLQHPRLDRPQQAPRRRSAAASADESGLATGVAGGAAQAQRIQQRHPRPHPLIIVVDHPRHLPDPRRGAALDPAGGDRGRPQPRTVAVAFGILTLLFNVPAGTPLGGNSYVDAVGAMMIFGVVFGLSIDYAVFLLSRMREHYDRHGDNAAAIAFGLEKTARVITGAAAIMMAVFIAFAGPPPIAGLSQLGIGLTIAVLLDATVVRIVLLPALMLLIGDRVWWLPRGLDRILPKFEV